MGTGITEGQLRSLVRAFLLEAAGPGKVGELLGRLESINARLAAAGAGSQKLGIAINRAAVGVRVGFALAPGGQVPGRKVTGLTTVVDRARAEVPDAVRSDVPYGAIYMYSPDSGPGSALECSGAWTVAKTDSTMDGWGPFLYDLAIEYATAEGGGLTSDRIRVSNAAAEVWGNYDKSRPDVEKAQLDLSDADIARVTSTRLQHLTPEDPTDDCDQRSAFFDVTDQGLEVDVWPRSPLSRVYKKPPRLMGMLRDRGLLWMS